MCLTNLKTKKEVDEYKKKQPKIVGAVGAQTKEVDILAAPTCLAS